MTILLVEDSHGQRLLLSAMLKSAGYNKLLEVATAQEALDLLLGRGLAAAQGIDLILLDLELPDMSSLDLCRQLKTEAALCDIPVIVVTGSKDSATLETAFAAGAMDFIAKPPDQAVLRARIRSALRLKEETDQRREREQELSQLAARLEEANRRLAEANLQLERLSALDGLTGIANRRRFDQALASEWRRASRQQSWLSLVMIDIDNFKAYNDSYGHQAGDETLRQVAATLAGGLTRAGELVARYGGEEFAAIIPGVAPPEAVALAERLRAAVEALQIAHAHSSSGRYVTISLGVSGAVPDPNDRPARLLELADRALYRAKQQGRNCVALEEA